MRGWKILLALGIVGIFVMPMMPMKVTGSEPNIPSPTQNGDTIFYECRGWWDLPNAVDHVSIWDKSRDKIIEADPYYEVWGEYSAPWGGKLKTYYPWFGPCLKYLTSNSYNNPGTTWGRIEQQTLQHDTIEDPDRPYEKLYYYHVNGGNPAAAIRFARSKLGHPFDYYSPWLAGANSKQIDESEEEYMNYGGTPYNLGGGYYCSEIVWAAWKKGGGVDLDTDDNSVMPQEIIDENSNTHITWYLTVTIPPP